MKTCYPRVMTKLEMYQPLINASLEFGDEHHIKRMKIETLDFDFEFKLRHDNVLELTSTKAVIRALGKTTKVAVGPDETHQSYESAYTATKRHWQAYFKRYREAYEATPAGIKSTRRRARAYQQRRRDQAKTIQERP